MSKTITFKNGTTLVVSQELADKLHNRIVNGAEVFQCFWDDAEGKSICVVNLSEVVCIA